MHVGTILHQHLEPLLQHLHRRRLATLLAAVVSCLSGPRLSLTDLGRRFEGKARLRHKIKRSDRLLGNGHLQSEARSIYRALCRVTLKRIGEPLILIDWSDLKADQSLHLLRASLPVGGRSLTLYEEVHPAEATRQPHGIAAFPATLGSPNALPCGTDRDRRCRLPGPFLPGGRTAGLSLGGAGAWTRLCAFESWLGELPDAVPAHHQEAVGTR